MGEIGLEECIEAVEKALNDEDDYVRTWGMMGIRRAIDRGGASPAFREAVFPRLVSLLDWDSPSASGHAPELLLRIDIERAEPILLSRAFFTARNPQLAYIIRSLNRADRKVPHPLLLPLLDELHGAENFRHELGYAEALIAYALNPDAQADCRFQTALTSTSKWIRPAAAESLAILHGIRDASGFAFRRWDDRSFDHLSQPQQYFCAVSAYNTEVNNGGHHQYFLNSSGDLWKSAVAGLHAIGANVRAEILKEAVTAFGEVGPLEERQMRCQQLAALSAEQDEVLGKLDDRYFECTEDVDVLLSLYAIKHKSHFSDQLK